MIMYPQQINSPLILLSRLREQRNLIRSMRFQNHMGMDAQQILRSALQLYLSSSCGCRVVRHHNPDFDLTNIEILTSTYDRLLCKFDSVINSLECITNQHDYQDDHYRGVGICQGQGFFDSTIHSHHTYQHTQQQHHQHPQQQQQQQHGQARQQAFNFVDGSGAGSNHTHPYGAPRGPNRHGHG